MGRYEEWIVQLQEERGREEREGERQMGRDIVRDD